MKNSLSKYIENINKLFTKSEKLHQHLENILEEYEEKKRS